MHETISDLPRASAATIDGVRLRPLHIIFHVPRCAGQTIHHHLSTHTPKGSYHRLRKRKGLGRLLLPRYRTDGMPDTGGLNVISGHWIGRSIESHFAGRKIARSILLRDPVSQFVSYYNFRMMRYISQGLRPYPPEIAYRARQRNFITHYILRVFAEIPWPRLVTLSAAEKYEEANRFLSDFWFAADHTKCDELIAALAPDLGIPAEAEARNSSEQWLQRVQWTPLAVSDLSEAMIEQIKQDNRLDQLLWETWKDAGQGHVTARPYQISRPYEISEEPLDQLMAAQTLRLLNQVRRRLRRGWTAPSGGDVVAPSSGASV